MTSTSPVDANEVFTGDAGGLRATSTPERVRLRDGDRFELRIAPVAKRIGEDVVRMVGYNGSIPGPCLHVDGARPRQGPRLHRPHAAALRRGRHAGGVLRLRCTPRSSAPSRARARSA